MTEGMSLSQLNHPTINMNNTEVNHNPNDKNSGEEYFDRRGNNQNQQDDYNQSTFVDRTAQLRATLNSLAALNAANVVKTKNKYKTNPIENKKPDNKNIIQKVEEQNEGNKGEEGKQ